MRLKWENLFSVKRERESKNKTDNEVSIRNEFDRDYERIIYSSSVRRLQDKAQVFPLQENDFTRTRLTHSLEVASLGRSMAWQISEKIMLSENEAVSSDDKKEFENYAKMKRLPSLVETACLVHDLGNPPFGHYGEDVIKKWFFCFFNSEEGKNLSLSKNEESDFCNYDGNAQNNHILSRLQFLNDQYGVNFTYATLATLMKYPWSSSEYKDYLSKPKFGYMQSEEKLFKEIKEATGIAPCRHPATYIVEAADDIAYLAADIEDAIKKGLLTWKQFIKETEIFNIIEDLVGNNKADRESIDTLIGNIKTANENAVPDIDLICFQNFKVCAQGIMIKNCIDAFMNNYAFIMEGKIEHGKSLLDIANINSLIDCLKSMSYKYCFPAEEVVTLELVGDKVLNDLLNLFVPAILGIKECKSAKTKENKLVKLISRNFVFVKNIEFNEYDLTRFTPYQKLQIVVDFISGMTDSYAVNLHKKLSNGKI